MAERRPKGDVATHWQNFVKAIRSLLSGLPDHRHQDQYLKIKEKTLALAEDHNTAQEIENGYNGAFTKYKYKSTEDFNEVIDVVVLELEAFPLAVAVHDAEAKEEKSKPGADKKLLSEAKTILGSVNDIFFGLSPFCKGVITALKETIDLFK